jgi:hypothetical protein
MIADCGAAGRNTSARTVRCDYPATSAELWRAASHESLIVAGFADVVSVHCWDCTPDAHEAAEATRLRNKVIKEDMFDRYNDERRS